MLPFPNHVRVQAILPGRSLLPADRFINTFHFRTDTNTPPTPEQETACRAAVADFYVTALGPDPALGTWLSDNISRTALACISRSYDLGELEPRTPTDTKWTMPNATVLTQLPNEVAICLSYHGPQNTVSQRGRLYIGPLSTQGLQTELMAPAVKDEIRNAVLNAAQVMATNLAGMTWVILKPALPERTAKNGAVLPARGNTSVDIKNVWVDDEWDTQRRRGLKARDRVTRALTSNPI